MVPDAFHDFFLGAAGVAGALIGLLFVAVSVVPETLREDSRDVARLRPAAALSAFLNALVVSLLALIPGTDFAQVVRILAAIGLASMVGLLALTVRDRAAITVGGLVGALVGIVGQGIVYGLQFLDGRALAGPGDPAAVLSGYAILVVVLFVLGISRAWEFVGANTPSLLRTLLGVGHPPRHDRGSSSGAGG